MIAKAATASRPRTRYAIGRDAAILVRLARVISDRLLDRILRLGLRPHYVKNVNQARGAPTRRFQSVQANHAVLVLIRVALQQQQWIHSVEDHSSPSQLPARREAR